MNGKRIGAGFVIVCVALAIVSNGLFSNETSPTKSSGAKASVKVQNCHLHLINDVLLASDRPGVLKYVELKEGDRVKQIKPLRNWMTGWQWHK